MTKASKTFLLAYLPLLAILIAALSGVRFPAWLPYPWLKTLHVFGAVIFLGNMLVGPVWLSIAVKDREKKMMDFAFRLLRLTDVVFTLPGIVLLVVTGVSMLSIWGGMYGQKWVWQSVILLFVMWAMSAPVLFCQEKLYRVVAQEPFDEAPFKKWMLWWSLSGTLVMLPPFLIFYLMIAKTGLW